MFWNISTRQWEEHPDCRCGQGDDWRLRRVNRPCYCRGLRPLDAKGKPMTQYDELLGIPAKTGGPR